MKWLIARLKEKSTWLSLITFIGTLVSSNVIPEKAGIISTTAIGLLTGIGITTKEGE